MTDSCVTAWEQLCDRLGTVSSYAISLCEQLPFMQLVSDTKISTTFSFYNQVTPPGLQTAVFNLVDWYGHADE